MLGLHVTSVLVVVVAAGHSCLPLGCLHLGVVNLCKEAKTQGFCAAQVENAINRATKEKRVAELTEALEQSTVVFGLRYKKVSVRPLLVFQTLYFAQSAFVVLRYFRFVQVRSTCTWHRAQLKRHARSASCSNRYCTICR